MPSRGFATAQFDRKRDRAWERAQTRRGIDKMPLPKKNRNDPGTSAARAAHPETHERYARMSLIALVAMIVLLVARDGGVAAEGPTIVTPDKVNWSAGSGPTAGTQAAVLEGDLSKAEPYTIRLKIPDGGKFGAHSHRDIEHVTVLAGTLLVGLGDTLDTSKMTALPAGSYVVIPSQLHHYAMARGETVLQIHGTGPSSFDMVGAAK